MSVLSTNPSHSFSHQPHAQLIDDRIRANEWVILGMTDKGEVFDVPDWPERLCGMLATRQIDKRLRYSDYLRPANIRGLSAVVVSGSLEQDKPASYAIVQRFVTDNQLNIRLGRTRNGTDEYPALQQKLREYIRI